MRVIMNPTHTLLVEDNPADARLVKEALNDNRIFANLHHTIDGVETMDFLRRQGKFLDAPRPDLILLDLNMPKMDGISVIKEISKRCPDTRILALTMHRDEEYVLEAFKSGANGYCLKSASQGELKSAIKAVLSGKTYISPEISDKVMEGYLETKKTIKTESSWDTVTQREREVLKLIGEGYRNKEISDYLCISVKTVEKHRANIMEKLDLHSASSLTAFAIQKGLVSQG